MSTDTAPDEGSDPDDEAGGATDEAALARLFDWRRLTLTAEGPAIYHRTVDDADGGGGAVMQVEETLTIERSVTDYEDFQALTKSRSTRPHTNNSDPVVEYLLGSTPNHTMVDDGSDWTITVTGGVADWLALHETCAATSEHYSSGDARRGVFGSADEYHFFRRARGASLLNNAVQNDVPGPNCLLALVAIHSADGNDAKTDGFLRQFRAAQLGDDADHEG